jgi:hypothetical protein
MGFRFVSISCFYSLISMQSNVTYYNGDLNAIFPDMFKFSESVTLSHKKDGDKGRSKNI